jgi:hypothetical protein
MPNTSWTYDQWAAKYGNLQNTNKPLDGVNAGTEYYQQTQQLVDAGLDLDQLQSFIRYWQGLRHNEDARAHPGNSSTVDPWYDKPEVKPDYSPNSNYVNGQAGYAASVNQPLYPNGQSAPALKQATPYSEPNPGIGYLQTVEDANDAPSNTQNNMLTSVSTYLKMQLLEKYQVNIDKDRQPIE